MTTNSPVTALTELALVAAKKKPGLPNVDQFSLGSGDAFLDQLMRLWYFGLEEEPSFANARTALMNDPDLASILARKGEQDPMILTPQGGSRQGFDGIIVSLLNNAARKVLINGYDADESRFVRLVLENYEELKRGVAGEQVRIYIVRGLAGLTIDPKHKISTPWGTIRGVEADPGSVTPFRSWPPKPQTTALLVSSQLSHITISREDSPEPSALDQEAIDDARLAQTLTPLLFALDSVDAAPGAPTITFETSIVPFAQNGGYSSTLQPVNPFVQPHIVAKDRIKPIEDLARTLADKYHESLQIASVRIVSAISHRLDKSDALIDAVTAWESLVGTRNETVYRVTASLSKLLEPDPEKRSAFRKKLGGIYDTRSRVVHGDTVDPAEIISSSDEAVKIALRAVLELTKRDDEWLSMKSSERSERLLLRP